MESQPVGPWVVYSSLIKCIANRLSGGSGPCINGHYGSASVPAKLVCTAM